MKRKYLSLCLITLAALGTAILGNSYRRAETAARAAASDTVEASITSQSSGVGPIRNVRFTLFDAGIRPNEMRIKAGLVNVSIEDRTYVAEGLIIQSVAGTERVAVGQVRKLKTSRGAATCFA